MPRSLLQSTNHTKIHKRKYEFGRQRYILFETKLIYGRSLTFRLGFTTTQNVRPHAI